MEDSYAVLGRELKLAVVGDTRVGKSTWISHIYGDRWVLEPTPTIGHRITSGCWFTTTTKAGLAKFNIWELSGSQNTAQDRAKCLGDIDAAVIMVDVGDPACIESAVYWYREIFALQNNSDNSPPVIIYSFKAYKEDDERGIDPDGISWPDEMGNTPFLYNPYLEGIPESTSKLIQWHECEMKPIGWILETLTGEKDVGFPMNYPPEPGEVEARSFWTDEMRREMADAFNQPLPEEDPDEDL